MIPRADPGPLDSPPPASIVQACEPRHSAVNAARALSHRGFSGTSRRSQLVLDAYIIEKIKRDQERKESERIPLQIEQVPHHRDRNDSRRDDRDRLPDRGVVIIDF